MTALKEEYERTFVKYVNSADFYSTIIVSYLNSCPTLKYDLREFLEFVANEVGFVNLNIDAIIAEALLGTRQSCDLCWIILNEMLENYEGMMFSEEVVCRVIPEHDNYWAINSMLKMQSLKLGDSRFEFSITKELLDALVQYGSPIFLVL